MLGLLLVVLGFGAFEDEFEFGVFTGAVFGFSFGFGFGGLGGWSTSGTGGFFWDICPRNIFWDTWGIFWDSIIWDIWEECFVLSGDDPLADLAEVIGFVAGGG